MKQIWDDFCDVYNSEQSNFNQFGFSLLNQLNLSSANSILDVGCGAAYLHPHILALKQRQSKLSGVDISPNMIKKAKEFLKSLNYDDLYYSIEQVCIPQHNYCIQTGSSEQLPFKEGEFDVYFSNLTLYLTDLKQSLLEANRVLGKKGKIAFNYWGQCDKCDIPFIPGTVLNQLGIPINMNQFSNNCQNIINSLKECNFGDIKYWYQDCAINIQNSQDLIKLAPLVIRNEILKQNQEMQEKICELIQEQIDLKFKNCIPLQQQALMFYAVKL